MAGHNTNLYRLQKKDLPRAGEVLAEAFCDDPIWRIVLPGATSAQRQGIFEVPVRYSMKYGEVYATSEKLEGIIAFVHGNLADMTLWRLFRSGAIWSGLKSAGNHSSMLTTVFKPLEGDRKEIMKGRPHFYLPVIGVASAFQGQGLGRKLLEVLIKESELAGIPVYLETETESNVRWYEHFGFETVQQITVLVDQLPMWEMVREPKA